MKISIQFLNIYNSKKITKINNPKNYKNEKSNIIIRRFRNRKII